MKKMVFFFLFFSLSANIVQASNHYYIKILKEELEIGTYEGRKFSPRKIMRTKIQDVDYERVRKMIFQKPSERALYYFHCYLGNAPVYHNHSVKFVDQLEGIDKTISIVWRSRRLGYKRSSMQSLREGEKISKLLAYLFAVDGNVNTLLCHSMGHRVFEGIMKRATIDFRFKLVVLAAADLDVDVFDENLNGLTEQSEKIVIYVHEKDRLLSVSKILLRRDRLGLHAKDYIKNRKDSENLEIVDVTNARGKLILDLSNHTYFKFHKGVRRDIQLLILGVDDDQRRYLTRSENNIKLMY